MASREPSETSPLLGPAPAHVNAGNAEGDFSRSGDQANGFVGEQANKKLKDDEEIPKNDEEEEDRKPLWEGLPEVRRRLKYILPAIAIGVFLSAGDQTIIVSAYGKIGSDLNALNKTSWIATAYFLTLCAFQPLYGKLSDIFGRKAALLSAYAIFGIGCLFCGLATNINQLIAARAFAGIGGGGMTTVVSILMSDIIPLRERGVWQGYINIIWASGASCGAPLGGIVADHIGWRWSFLVQAPLCVVAFVSVAFALKLPPMENAGWKAKLRRVDFLGALVLILAIFTLLLGLDRGSNVAWTTPTAIAPLCISFPLFATFVLVEQKYAHEPFAPRRIFYERGLLACYLCNFFSLGGWLSALFYLPLYFQAVTGFSATQAGIMLLPTIIAGVTGSLLGGFVMKRTGRYYWATVVALTILPIGMMVIVLFTGLLAHNVYATSIGMFMGGLGNGISITTCLVGLIANAAPADQAIATACSYLFRSLGSVIGLSASSTIVQQTLRVRLRERLENSTDADKIVDTVRQNLDSIATFDPAIQEIVRKCYAAATRNGFIVMFFIVCCAGLSSWFIKEKRLSK